MGGAAICSDQPAIAGAGIRTLTPHQREQAARWNVDIYKLKALIVGMI